MWVFKNKAFARFARKARITDAGLCAAIADASRGLIDADLGGGVVKQRVARQGGGKSGGFPDDHPLPDRRAGVLRSRLCQERTGQHPRRRAGRL